MPGLLVLRRLAAGLVAAAALVAAIAGHAHAADAVRIAAIFAETGEASVGTAQQDFRGAALAVAAINASGGLLGRPAELLSLDNASTPLMARQAAKKAVAAGVLGVVGGPFSGLTRAMAEVCQEAGTPLVATIATHPDVTRVGDCISRVCYTDEQQGELLARFAFSGLSAKTAAVMTDMGSDYSQGLAAVFSRVFTALGGRIVSEQSFKSRDTDFAPQLAAVAAAGPDVVFLPSYAVESGLIIRQAMGMGLGATFVGGDGWGPSMAESANGGLHGHYYATHWHPDSPIPAGQAVAKAYLEAHGAALLQPDAILAYDAVMALAEAVRRAGSLDRQTVAAALAKTAGLQGGTGTITLDAERNPVGKEVCIMRFEHGQAVFHTSFR
jgi:branched-chain amino acid transport system substrate-binding protein